MTLFNANTHITIFVQNLEQVGRTHDDVYKMGLVETKPVFGVSNKARLKPVSSATETS